MPGSQYLPMLHVPSTHVAGPPVTRFLNGNLHPSGLRTRSVPAWMHNAASVPASEHETDGGAQEPEQLTSLVRSGGHAGRSAESISNVNQVESPDDAAGPTPVDLNSD
jgi:hypothetical protein